MFLNISEAVNLAFHASTYLARENAGKPIAAAKIAGFLCVSEAHLVKVLQRLKKAGLIDSVRGPHGGYALARDVADIRLLDIYEAIDGAVDQRRCLLGHERCKMTNCVFGTLIPEVNQRVSEHFSTTTLAMLTRGDRSR